MQLFKWTITSILLRVLASGVKYNTFMVFLTLFCQFFELDFEMLMKNKCIFFQILLLWSIEKNDMA